MSVWRLDGIVNVGIELLLIPYGHVCWRSRCRWTLVIMCSVCVSWKYFLLFIADYFISDMISKFYCLLFRGISRILLFWLNRFEAIWTLTPYVVVNQNWCNILKMEINLYLFLVIFKLSFFSLFLILNIFWNEKSSDLFVIVLSEK